MLEDKIEELIGALEANTEILQKLHDLRSGDVSTRTIEDAKAGVAEAEQEMYDRQGASKKKTSKKKASKKKTSNKTLQQTYMTTITIEEVKAELVKIDKESAKAVLKAFGCVKLTDLKPENYEAAIDEAKAYMDDGDFLD